MDMIRKGQLQLDQTINLAHTAIELPANTQFYTYRYDRYHYLNYFPIIKIIPLLIFLQVFKVQFFEGKPIFYSGTPFAYRLKKK